MEFPPSQKPLLWALGLGAATFFIQMTSFSRSSSNGVLTSCSYTDYFALLAGAGLILFGLVNAVKGRQDPSTLFMSMVIAVLGAVHVARGMGLIMSPCG